MTNQALLDYINHFQPLSKEAEHALLELCSFVHIKKNRELQPVGHTCRTIYFIRKGIARVFYYKDGIDITEYFAFENNLIARVESLFTGRPSKKAIQVLEEAEIIAINAAGLFRLYDQFREIERLARKITEAAYVDNVNRLESLQFHSAEERYKDLLEQEPDILKRVPLKYIASYLGITPVSLSRIRSAR
jgi:CRP-like cAMP-binding protein